MMTLPSAVIGACDAGHLLAHVLEDDLVCEGEREDDGVHIVLARRQDVVKFLQRILVRVSELI